MKVMLTGAGGQLGQALIATQPALLGDQPFKLMAFTRSELDLSNPSDCKEAVDKHLPEWIINAGAYTAVDKAQHEPDLARIVNVDGPAILAQQLALRGGRMLQLSTDFVFNGLQCTPYSPFQEATPTSIYGQTKAQSEAAVLGALGDRAFVMRTSWLYGPVGKNFALTMLRLHEEKNEILPEGGQIIDTEKLKIPMPMAGFVTSSYYSSNLQRSFALGLIKNGHQRYGENVYINSNGSIVRAQITQSCFIDPDGIRLND